MGLDAGALGAPFLRQGGPRAWPRAVPPLRTLTVSLSPGLHDPGTVRHPTPRCEFSLCPPLVTVYYLHAAVNCYDINIMQ